MYASAYYIWSVLEIYCLVYETMQFTAVLNNKEESKAYKDYSKTSILYHSLLNQSPNFHNNFILQDKATTMWF